MAEALIPLDALVASVWQSYADANELILQSCRSADAGAQVAAEPGESMGWADRFIVNNESDNPPAAIPLALFHLPVLYYLSDLHLELPCYRVVRPRFWGGRNARRAVLHASVPTFWQRLFYICHVYRFVIDADADKVETRFVTATREEFTRLLETKAAGPSDWEFELTEEQAQQLQALPVTVARPVYWSLGFGRVWGWLREKLSIRH